MAGKREVKAGARQTVATAFLQLEVQGGWVPGKESKQLVERASECPLE